jgi:hypothetical protein
MVIVTWATRQGAKLPQGWDPVPLTLKNGATIRCPYDGAQPYIVRPQSADIAANIAWATKMKSDYMKFSDAVMQGNPQGSGAIVGYRSAQAATFARSVAQNGRFDYQRPPRADMFLTFYTSFASYNLACSVITRASAWTICSKAAAARTGFTPCGTGSPIAAARASMIRPAPDCRNSTNGASAAPSRMPART